MRPALASAVVGLLLAVKLGSGFPTLHFQSQFTQYVLGRPERMFRGVEDMDGKCETIPGIGFELTATYG